MPTDRRLATFCSLLIVATAAAGCAGGSARGGGRSAGAPPGFHVRDRFLYDRCGEKVVLRGINEMVVWSDTKDGVPSFAEIAKTGANAVRIVWDTTGGVPEMDAAIANALAVQLIPIIELHDATGKWELLPSLVDYWTRPEVVAVLKKHETSLLINIGNEVGDGRVTAALFRSGYGQAVNRLRAAGIHALLVLDAPRWGQNIDVLQAAGPGLLRDDPDHNLLFSVHLWWSDRYGKRLTEKLNQSVAMNLPLIVGEFAQHSSAPSCETQRFDYGTLLTLTSTLQVGWLAWSWGGVKNKDCAGRDPFDMTTAGTFETLTGWGQDVAVGHAASIKHSSVRPASLTKGACQL
jgi:mannan endo-1,4-beta-mannosidase